VDLGGICHRQLAYLEVLEGVFTDETYFGLNYTIDSLSHTDKIEIPRALEQAESLCNCRCVGNTQIKKFWREACVRRATTTGIGTLALSDVQSILGEPSKPGACVQVAISDGCSKETQSSRNAHTHGEPSGRNAIGIEPTPRTLDIDPSQRTVEPLSTNTGLPLTGLQESNMTIWSESRRLLRHMRASYRAPIRGSLPQQQDCSGAPLPKMQNSAIGFLGD
jgi:hypothetical protein